MIVLLCFIGIVLIWYIFYLQHKLTQAKNWNEIITTLYHDLYADWHREMIMNLNAIWEESEPNAP